jgi:hypothetical protein
MTSSVEIYKTLKKEIEKYIWRWKKNSHAYRSAELTLWQRIYYWIYLQMKCTTYQNPVIVHRCRKKSKNSFETSTCPEYSKQSLSKWSMLEISQYLICNYTGVIVKKIGWYWHKHRPMKWNRRPRNKPSNLQPSAINMHCRTGSSMMILENWIHL